MKIFALCKGQLPVNMLRVDSIVVTSDKFNGNLIRFSGNHYSVWWKFETEKEAQKVKARILKKFGVPAGGIFR